MSQITVRQAILADALSITDLYRASVESWTQTDADGEKIPADYNDLTLFERWQNAGPWASVEMCAVHLANLLRGTDGIPLVAEVEGEVRAEAEIYIGQEPEPFGHHINIARMVIHPEYDDIGLGSALLTYVLQIAEAIHCKRVTVARVELDAPLYEHYGFHRAHIGHEITFPAQEGRVFYKATELKQFDPAQIVGWHMPLGRYQNAREEWDRMPPGFWNSVPEIVEIETARVQITVTGQEAYAMFQEHRENPEVAQVFVWTRRPINNLVVLVLRDWAARHGYKSLRTFAWDYQVPALEIDVTPLEYAQHLYARTL